MGVINVLPQLTINKIAAGEVIERPASVVKELVENSLDAQVTSISVEVEDGGRKLIRVVDDGFGIGFDDLPLAFGSHATSKLKTGDDLFFISTLGFRGEALASIGSISHARIVSRLRGALEGGEVEISGGTQTPPKAKGAPEGTTVEVADLFFNTPARRKFLKSPATEFAHIVELISRIALANYRVAFKLTHNGRETLNLKAAETRRDRLADLYGRDLAEQLIAVDSGEGPVSVTGFAAPPTQCRPNSKMQLTYVNGRFVRDRNIAHAISAAYQGLLTQGRYPSVFLFVQVDPREVDVNVHPTKIEVRFHDTQRIHQTVFNAVAESLREADLSPSFEHRAPAPAQQYTPPVQAPLSGAPRTPFDRDIVRSEPFSTERKSFGPYMPPPVQSGAAPAHATPREYIPPQPAQAEINCFQVHNAYIIEERADGVAIIDQHALHERIIFEEIKKRLTASPLERQKMLIPAVINLSAGEMAVLLCERETLAAIGIEFTEFGKNAVAINSVPLVIGKADPADVIHEFLGEVSAESKDTPVDKKRLAAAKLVACKAAIKAGTRLTPTEIRSLLAKAANLPERDTCPHGRPTCIFIPYKDLEKQFKRT